MKLQIAKNGGTLTIGIIGSIDTVTAPELEKELNAQWDGVKELILDFTGVDYISSAGLRVMMTADQHMDEIDGTMSIRNANDDVKEVFEMTGFDELFHFE